MAVIEAIATIYLEADVATVEFDISSSPGNTYEHLQLRMNGATNSTYDSGRYRDAAVLYFNTSVATTNSDYSRHTILARDALKNAYPSTGDNYWSTGSLMGTSKGVAHFGGGIVDILDYRNGSKNTTMMSSGGALGPDTGNTEFALTFASGLWDNVAAVTKILLIPDLGTAFRRGSEFTLYGLNSS
jgi:hypothetical protein